MAARRLLPASEMEMVERLLLLLAVAGRGTVVHLPAWERAVRLLYRHPVEVGKRLAGRGREVRLLRRLRGVAGMLGNRLLLEVVGRRLRGRVMVMGRRGILHDVRRVGSGGAWGSRGLGLRLRMTR